MERVRCDDFCVVGVPCGDALLPAGELGVPCRSRRPRPDRAENLLDLGADKLTARVQLGRQALQGIGIGPDDLIRATPGLRERGDDVAHIRDVDALPTMRVTQRGAVVARVGPRRGPKKWASVASPANAGHEISPPPSRWRPGVRSRSTWVTVSRWPEFQGSAEKWGW
jgi:hypothetical protein